MSGSSVGNGGQGRGPAFTVAQWAEMEHQALIFKYFKAGVPVPPDLLAPIRSSFNLLSPDFLRYHPILGYSTYCGKKIDPEPGRCRRTDGKKWRCSKDAHPDSKYCERHMNRGRNRSRKLVESQTTSQSPSVVTSGSVIGSCSRSGSFQNMSLQSMVNTGGQCFGSDVAQLNMESIPYGIATSGTRGRNGAEEHNFMSEASGRVTCTGMDSTVDNPWRLMVPQAPLKSELRNSSLLLNSSSQVQTFQDIEHLSVDTTIAKQQQHQYVGGGFGLPGSLKHGQHSLQPFFDEWHKSRDPGFHQNDHRSTETLSNTTHISMSNAMAPAKFFTRSSESSNDAYT